MLAALAGMGILIQAASSALASHAAVAVVSEAAGGDWAEMNSTGKPAVVPVGTRLDVSPIQPVRGLLFFMKMDLRSAGRDDLSALPGIDGPAASRIVDLREALGRPLTWGDIDRVPGIGGKSLDVLRHFGELK